MCRIVIVPEDVFSKFSVFNRDTDHQTDTNSVTLVTNDGVTCLPVNTRLCVTVTDMLGCVADITDSTQLKVITHKW